MTRTTVASFLLGLVLFAPGPGGGTLEADAPLLANAAPPTGLEIAGPSAEATADVPDGHIVARIGKRGEATVLQVIASSTITERRTCSAEIVLRETVGSPMSRMGGMPREVLREKVNIELAGGETRMIERPLGRRVVAPVDGRLPFGTWLAIETASAAPRLGGAGRAAASL